MKSHVLEAQEASRDFEAANLEGQVLVFHAGQNVTASKGLVEVIYFKGIPSVLPSGTILAVYSPQPLPELLSRALNEDTIVCDG